MSKSLYFSETQVIFTYHVKDFSVLKMHRFLTLRRNFNGEYTLVISVSYNMVLILIPGVDLIKKFGIA